MTDTTRSHAPRGNASLAALRPGSVPLPRRGAAALAFPRGAWERARGQIVLLAAGLALLCVVAKGVLLPFPVSTAGEFVRWLLRLAVVVSPDICFVAGLTAACFLIAWLCRQRVRAARMATVAFYVIFYLAALYTVASVPIYRFTMVPLTLPSLYLMGGGESASSILFCVSRGTVFSLIFGPLAVVGVALLLRRATWPQLLVPRSPLLAAAALALTAAYGIVCHNYVKTHWDDPNRWERRIAQNPHTVFVTSCVTELWHADASELFADPDESGFTNVGYRHPHAAGGHSWATDGHSEHSEESHGMARTQPSEAHDDKHPRPRNVLWILLESTSAEYVSLYNSRYPTMPNLERLAKAGGVVYENVYVQAPCSCQSLAALTASIYPRPDWGLMVRDEPDFDIPTVAEVLVDHGYRTCFAHSGYWRWKARDRYLKRRGAQTLIDADTIAGEQVNTWGVADRAMFQATLNWIDADRSRPFFALAYTIETHHPYVATGPLRDFGVSDPDFNRYLNSLRNADETIGWVMDELRRRGLEDSTLVIVTADHGESFGQHNQRVHSFSLYESAVHVPLVLLHPALRETLPPRIADVARHIDIAPTLLDSLGIDAPPDWQGRSLLRPASRDDQGTAAYFFAAGNHVVLGLRDGPHKYHYHLSTGDEELFDLAADPAENHNLAATSAERCAAYKRKIGGFVSYQRRFLAEHRVK